MAILCCCCQADRSGNLLSTIIFEHTDFRRFDNILHSLLSMNLLVDVRSFKWSPDNYLCSKVQSFLYKYFSRSLTATILWYLQLIPAEISMKISCFVVSIQDHAEHCFKNKLTLCFIFPCFCSHKFTVRYFKLTSRNRGALNIKLICIQWVISMLLTVPPMFALLGRMHQVVAFFLTSLFRNFQRKK